MTTRKPRTPKPVAETTEALIAQALSPELIAKAVAELKKQQAAVQAVPVEEPVVEPSPVDDTVKVIAELKQQIAELRSQPKKDPIPAIKVEPVKIRENVAVRVLRSIPFATIGGWTAAFVGLYLYWASQQPQTEDTKPAATISSVLDDAYKADRKSRIAVLKELETKSFKSDQEKLDWINTETDTRRQTAFREYLNRMAEAVNDGKTGKMASDLEAGR